MSDGDAGAVGVFTTDRALIVRSWDPWMAEATRVPESEALGRSIAELFPDLEERGLLARLRGVAEDGTPAVLAAAFHRYLIPCPPRAPATHFARMQQHVVLSPLRAGDELVGVVVTIEDVTARLDRERDLAAELHSPDEAVRLRAVEELAEADTRARDASAALAAALGDRDWRVRRVAAGGLARGRGEGEIEALLDAIRDRHRDPAVLNAAISALVGADHDVTPDVLALLASGDAEVRTYAALTLGQIGDRRAVPALLAALADADENVRFHAVEALGRIGDHEAAEPLAALAESRDFFLAFGALDALALIGDPSVAPRLVPLLDDEMLREPVVGALGEIGGEEVVVPLARLLGRPGVPVTAVAGALAAVHRRLQEGYGEGSLVADLARRVPTPEAARQLIDALPGAGDGETDAVVLVLGWLDAPGVDEALARMLARPAARRTAADALVRRGPAAVAPLVDALEGAARSDDDEACKAAAAALGRIGSPRAVPALLALLGGSADVAVVAAGALGSIGDRGAFDALLSLFDRPEAAVRQAAVAALNSIGHPDMPGRIRELLAAPSPLAREAAAKVAGYFGYGECIEPMLALCADEDETVRRTAVEQLAHLDDPRALQALRDALSAGPPAVRVAAARALAQADAEVAIPLLMEACRDTDPWVRYHAARSAGRHGAAGAVPTLVELAIGDAMPPVRIAAVEALGEIGAADGVETLGSIAGDPDMGVARPALLALGQVADPAALSSLVAALDSPQPERQAAALAALGRRTEESAVPAVARLARTARDPGVREQAVDVLGRIAAPAAVEALVSLAAEPRRRDGVIAALARLPEVRVDVLGDGLRHPDVAVRCAVVEALARMRHGGAARLLAAALEDDAPAVRLAAARALGRLDLREERTRLRDVARTDESVAVRRAAQDALTR